MRNILLSAAILATFASPAFAHPEHEEMPRPAAYIPSAKLLKKLVPPIGLEPTIPALRKRHAREIFEVRFLIAAV